MTLAPIGRNHVAMLAPTRLSEPGRRRLALWLLCGPGALGAAIAVLAAMPLWFPRGAGGVDNLIIPLLIFPGVWAALFMYAALTDNPRRAGLVLVGLTVLNGAAAVLAALGHLGI